MEERYNCAIEGDWGSLVSLWERDSEHQERRLHRRTGGQRDGNNHQEVDLGKTSKEALEMMSSGNVSKALKRKLSHGFTACRNK